VDVVLLARLQFALTAIFHFLFPPITIGLTLLIAILETLRWRTGHDVYARASDFWLKLLAINFVVGVASGIVLEFEFGMNWVRYSRFVGDIFGAPLAAEAVFAFFLESTFIGLLLFGRDRISSFVRWLSAVMVWLGTMLSAFWIIVANSWMQTPAGFRVVGGRAELTNFAAAVLNPSTIPRFLHTITSAWACGGFLMAAIGAWYFLRDRGNDVARVSLRLGVITGAVATLLVIGSGDGHARQVAHTQQAKFAAMEGLYSTQAGAPLVLFALPPGQHGRTAGPELLITNLTSFLAFGNFEAPVRGLEEFPRDEWPPLAATFLSFHNMVIVGNLMAIVAIIGAVLLRSGTLERTRWALRAIFLAMPLPMIAIQLGWLAAEVGRQPWIVQGVMRTAAGTSKVVTAPEIVTSIALFATIYVLLASVWFFLLRREVMRGPQGKPLIDAHFVAMPPLEALPAHA